MPPFFASVIPLLRTPFGVDAFDYAIPEPLIVARGDLVHIPFRNQTLLGIVQETRETCAVKNPKNIIKQSGLHLPAPAIDLGAFIARRQCVSQATVWHAWLRRLPKQLPTYTKEPQPFPETSVGIFKKSWHMDPETALLDRAKNLLASSDARRILLFTPWVCRARRWNESLNTSLVLHSELADGQAFRNWHAWLRGDVRCLVTTRLGAWLSPLADVVLIDEPEQDDYKQDEMSPRYDARTCFAWTSTHINTKVEAFGLTPPLADALDQDQPAVPQLTTNLILSIRHPAGRSAIPLIQADTVNTLINHDGPRIILHPIRGLQAKLTCRDCGWQARCASCGFSLSSEVKGTICRHCGKHGEHIEQCNACGGTDLGKSWPGIEKLKLLWTKFHSNIEVGWRDLSMDALDAAFTEGSLVALTDGALLGSWSEEVRRDELRILLFRRLAARVAQAHGTLLVQTGEATAPTWERYARPTSLQELWGELLQQRRLFGYPPVKRLAKILVTGSADEAQTLFTELQAACAHLKFMDWTCAGPFEVAFRRVSGSTRFAIHLQTPARTTDDELLTVLTPFAKRCIIDLDSINFFR